MLLTGAGDHGRNQNKPLITQAFNLPASIELPHVQIGNRAPTDVLTITYTQKHAWKLGRTMRYSQGLHEMNWVLLLLSLLLSTADVRCRLSCSIVSNLGGLAEWGSEEYPEYIFNLFRQNDVMIRRGNCPRSKHPPRTEHGERRETESEIKEQQHSRERHHVSRSSPHRTRCVNVLHQACCSHRSAAVRSLPAQDVMRWR